MREETECWLNRVSLGVADPARHRRRSAQPADADQGARPVGELEAPVRCRSIRRRRPAAAELKGARPRQNIDAARIREETHELHSTTALLARLAGIFAAAAAQPAHAAEDPAKYPSQPIRMIVPFAPGGASDFAARLMQPGICRRRSASRSSWRTARARRAMSAWTWPRAAAPDGYTIFLGNVGTISINPSMFADLTVKPEKDFIPVSIVADTPGILIAQAEIPAQQRQRARRVRQGAPRQGELRLARQRQPQPPRDGDLCQECGARDDAHPLQGRRRPGGGRRAWAAMSRSMFSTISSAIKHVQGRPAEGPRRDDKGAAAGHSRRRDAARAGVSRPSQLVLAGHPGAGRDAARRSSTSCMLQS